MFDRLIRLLGGVPGEVFIDHRTALMRITFLDTPSAAHGVKKAVKIANEALEKEWH